MGDLSYLRGNVVHRSWNRGYTLHAVHNLLVEDNIAYDVVGHAFFIEDGFETGNILKHNLALGVKRPTEVCTAPPPPLPFRIPSYKQSGGYVGCVSAKEIKPRALENPANLKTNIHKIEAEEMDIGTCVSHCKQKEHTFALFQQFVKEGKSKIRCICMSDKERKLEEEGLVMHYSGPSKKISANSWGGMKWDENSHIDETYHLPKINDVSCSNEITANPKQGPILFPAGAGDAFSVYFVAGFQEETYSTCRISATHIRKTDFAGQKIKSFNPKHKLESTWIGGKFPSFFHFFQCFFFSLFVILIF